MNIKTVANIPIQQIEPKRRVDGNAKLQDTTERDANGQQEKSQGELKRHLTQQEFDDAIKALEETPGLRANNLSIKVISREDHRVIEIHDGLGQVVRRLSEAQLWAATRDKDKQTGKFLDKAM